MTERDRQELASLAIIGALSFVLLIALVASAHPKSTELGIRSGPYVELRLESCVMNPTSATWETNMTIIAEDGAYFLHIRSDGSEIRMAEEVPEMHWKTYYVRVVEVGDNYVIEQTTTVYDYRPHGEGWRRMAFGHHKWQRTRVTEIARPKQLSIAEQTKFDDIVMRSVAAEYTDEVERHEDPRGRSDTYYTPCNKTEIRELLLALWGKKLRPEVIDRMQNEIALEREAWPEAWRLGGRPRRSDVDAMWRERQRELIRAERPPKPR